MAARAGVLVSVLLVAAACAGEGSTPTPSGPATSVSSPSSAGAPPPTRPATHGAAEPTPVPGVTSSPRSLPGDLLVALYWSSDTVEPATATIVTGSGLVVWHDAGLWQLLLTPAGLVWVGDQLTATGLLDRSGQYGAVQRPGVVPPAHGVTGYRFIVPIEGGLATVDTDDPRDYEPEYWIVPPEMQLLGSLAASMVAADRWIPADHIAEARSPYRPAEYLLAVTLVRNGGPPTSVDVDVDAIDWPLAVPLTAFGLPVGSQEPGQMTRCGVISAATAHAIVDAEASLPFRHDTRAISHGLWFPWAAGDGTARIMFQQLLPGEHDCTALVAGG